MCAYVTMGAISWWVRGVKDIEDEKTRIGLKEVPFDYSFISMVWLCVVVERNG